MNQIFQEVLYAAMSLPFEQRSQLVDELLDSIPPEDAPPLDDQWREIVRQRLQEYDEGRVQGIPWEDVQARVRDRILRHGQSDVSSGG